MRSSRRRYKQLEGAINLADFNDEEQLGKGKEIVEWLKKLGYSRTATFNRIKTSILTV